MHFLEPHDATKTTGVINNPSGTSREGGELAISAGIIAGIAVSTSAVVVLLAVITTTVIIVVVISYFRRNKKRDKTSTQLHHTLPIYDTIPDLPEPCNDTTAPQGAISRHTTVLERRDQNYVMQQPNRHPMRSSRLEGHNNIMILDDNQQRARESIQIRENEAYMYAVADQYVHVSVQETNPEYYENAYPNRKEVENYIYPITNKWVNIKQND